MEKLQYYMRHQKDSLQERFILVFNRDEVREFFEKKLPNNTFEEITYEMAEHLIRIGIDGKTVPYGYTYLLTKEEMEKVDVANWEETANLLAIGNERIYERAMKEKNPRDKQLFSKKRRLAVINGQLQA